MKICCVVLCLFLAISSSLVLAGHKEPSKNLYRFLTLLSGYFDNEDQLSTDRCTNGLDYHDTAINVWKPVNIKSLNNQLTLYNEVVIAGQVSSRKIWVVSEDRCGVIHVKSLQVLDFDSYLPGDFEDIDFSHVRYQSRTNNSNCEILFYSVDENVFVGTVPDCFDGANGTLPQSGITLTCYSVSFHTCNFKGLGRLPILPYINFKIYSYPLTSAMTKGAHFETDCYYPLY